MKRLIFFSFCALVIATQPILASDGGFFLGIGAGQAMPDASIDDFDDGSLIDAALDEDDGALRIFGGYRFGKRLALELAYLDLGEVDFRGESDGSQAGGGGYGAGPVAGTIETQAALFELIGAIPLGIVSIYGKVGAAIWASDGEFLDSGFIFDLEEFDLEESGVGLVYGAGVEIAPSARLGIRVEYEKASDALAGEEDIAIVTGSVLLRF